MRNREALACTIALLVVGTAQATDISSTRVWTCEIRQALTPGADGRFIDSSLLELIANANKKPTFTFDPVSGILRYTFWPETYVRMDKVWPGGAGNSLKGLRENGSEIDYLAIETWREPHVAVVINGYQEIYIGTCKQ